MSSTSPKQQRYVRATDAGFKVYAEKKSARKITVVESALKVAGPVVWVFARPDNLEEVAGLVVPDGLQLTVEEARVVRDGLALFVLDAEGGDAPAPPPRRRLFIDGRWQDHLPDTSEES